MGLTNFPNGISSMGVPIPSAEITTGSVFFVSSVTGSDGNTGKNTGKPFATLNKAVSACTASKGDVVYLMPGHAESIGDTTTTGAPDIDKIGVSVIGVGSGTLQPKFTFAHADADFIVSASNCSITNVQFEAAITLVKIGTQISAAVVGTSISGCKFTVATTATDEFLITVNVLAGCDDTTVEGCSIDMGLGGAAAGVKLVGASNGVYIRGNTIVGDYSLACISAITTLSTNVYVESNLLVNGFANALGSVAVIDFITGCLGVIRNNTWFSDVATHLLMAVADTMLFSYNMASDDSGSGTTTIDTSATVVASTDG